MRVWRWPLVLGVLTVCGLISALLGEGGMWWIFCWITLSLPLAIIVACVSRAKR